MITAPLSPIHMATYVYAVMMLDSTDLFAALSDMVARIWSQEAQWRVTRCNGAGVEPRRLRDLGRSLLPWRVTAAARGGKNAILRTEQSCFD